MSQSPAITPEILNWLSQPAPRYTSYPAANHFRPLQSVSHGNWLARLEPGVPVGVYLHIPYCTEMCWFCGCNTKATRRHQPVSAYVDTLTAEIDLVSQRIGARPSLHSIHFGGGSPTMLSIEEMGRIFDALELAFHWDAATEVSIEIDPRHLTAEKASAYGAFGFNRASIGVQDAEPAVMQAIHRVQPFETVIDAADQLHAAGVERFGIDLMYGLPHQTSETIARTLQEVIALQPDRIASFSYAHLPQLKKHQRLIDEAALPDAAAKAAMYLQIAEGLEAAGYSAIGMDHFALPGDGLAQAAANGKLRRNFQGYTDLPNDLLIGLGASAISQLGLGIAQNATPTRDHRLAIRDGRLATARGWAFTNEDAMRRDVINELMCRFRADVGAILTRHGYPRQYLDFELASLRLLEKAGIVEVKDRLVTFHSPLKMLVRCVAVAFDAFAAPAVAAGHHSRVA